MRYSFLLILSLFYLNLFSQCDGRYENEIFSQVSKTTVEYSDVYDWSLADSGLDMDIYQATDDTASSRPLIIFAHGGVYIAGNKNNPTMVSLCEAFARRGYVTASIQYRLTSAASLLNPNASDIFTQTVLNSISDMKASIRYFRKDAAENENLYKINTNLIFVGGYSAGAVTAAHLSVIDEDQVPSEYQSFFDLAGGIDGNSGNPGYSSEVSGVVSLAGAINTLDFIDDNDEPMVSLHATDDNTVSYECANALGNAALPYLCGSGEIHEKLEQEGVLNDLYTFSSGGHAAPILDLSGTAIPFISDFLYNIVCQTSNINNLENKVFKLFPNPCNNTLNINYSGLRKDLLISDVLARKVMSISAQNSDKIDVSSLKKGMYFLHFNTPNSSKQIFIKN